MLTLTEREDSCIAGNVAGGKAAAETNKRKYGEDYYINIGKKGQKAYLDKPKSERKPRGFAAVSVEKRREAGRKGGSISRRIAK